MDISLILPSASELTGDERAHVYRSMCSMWGLEPRMPMRNPCALAVPLTHEVIASTDPSEYLVTPKTDGVRYLLVLTTNSDGLPIAVMIGRDMRMFEVELWAPDTFFQQGCLIDGELAWDSGSRGVGVLVYCAFDCMMMGGTRYRDKPLVDRMVALNGALLLSDTQREWVEVFKMTDDADKLQFIPEEGKIVATPNNSHMLRLRPKAMERLGTWASSITGTDRGAWVSDERIETDGLVFTPMALPVYVNTHRRLFKWKPVDLMTVDIEVESGRTMGVDDSGSVCQIDTLCGRNVSLASDEIDNGIFECSIALTPVSITLTPVRRRKDKHAPNSIKTIEATVEGKAHAVTIAEVAAWARRASG
jgi:hypothetical protein